LRLAPLFAIATLKHFERGMEWLGNYHIPVKMLLDISGSVMAEVLTFLHIRMVITTGQNAPYADICSAITVRGYQLFHALENHGNGRNSGQHVAA
jgi:hypothetical protein